MTARKTALIATLPKSGTWFAHSFLWSYKQMLNNAAAYADGSFIPDIKHALRDRKIRGEASYRDMPGIHELFVCHSVCPGFYELGDKRFNEWEALYFPLMHDSYSWYNCGEAYMRDHAGWDNATPQLNSEARIVYLYRNPLDHFVSHYRHLCSHVDPKYKCRVMSDGSLVRVSGIGDFVFNFGALGAFIKHFYSFRQMQLRFPGQVMMVPYERMAVKPETTMESIMAFIGIAPDSPEKQRMARDALGLCSRKSMMALEAEIGHSMLGDRTGSEKHVSNSANIGKWMGSFSDDDLAQIEAALNLFDISLDDFHIDEDDNYDLSVIVGISQEKRRVYQNAFLLQQMASVGIQVSWLRRQLDKARTEARFMRLLRHNSIISTLQKITIRLRA